MCSEGSVSYRATSYRALPSNNQLRRAGNDKVLAPRPAAKRLAMICVLAQNGSPLMGVGC